MWIKNSLNADLEMVFLGTIRTLREAVLDRFLKQTASYCPSQIADYLSSLYNYSPMKFVKSYFLATAALSAWTQDVEAQAGCPDFTTYAQVCSLEPRNKKI